MDIDFPALVGPGYYDVLDDDESRIICMSGSRASGKSTTAAYKVIRSLLIDPEAHCLMIRANYNTLKDSCYAEIERIICDEDRLGNTCLKDYFTFLKNPLEIRFWRNGKHKGNYQTILFRGLDKADKIQSINRNFGYIRTVVIDEAHEIKSGDEFDKLNLSLRTTKEGAKQQIIICQNMYSKYGWVYQDFYKEKREGVRALIKNYECNSFLKPDNPFFQVLESLKHTKPIQYAIYKGEIWGGGENTVYCDEDYVVENVKVPDLTKHLVGIDWGFNDPTAILDIYVDQTNKQAYVKRMTYKSELLNEDIAKIVMKYGNPLTICDSANPKDIAALKKMGINAKPCRKGPDSIVYGIRKVKEYKIHVDFSCEDLIREFQTYEKDIEKDKPIDANNHALDSLRYVIMAVENQSSAKTFNMRSCRENAKNNIR